MLRSPEEFAARASGTFLVEHAVIETLSALVGGAVAEVREEVLTYVADQPAMDDGLRSQDLTRLLRALDPSDVDADLAPRVREAAERQPDGTLSAALFGLLIDDAEVVDQLLDRVRDGDHNAMSALQRYDLLDRPAAQRLMEIAVESMDRIVIDAGQGRFTVRTHDPAHELATLATYYPEDAPWASLLRFLGAQAVPGEFKRSACLVLAARAQHIPPDVGNELRAVILQLQPSPGRDLPFGFGKPLAGAHVRLAAAIGALDDDSVARELTRLVTGSREERRDAAELAHVTSGPSGEGMLVALLADSHGDVRATAARGLAWLATDPHLEPSALVLAALERAYGLAGVLVPLYIVGALDDDRHEGRSVTVAQKLTGHTSALVRTRAAEALRLRHG